MLSPDNITIAFTVYNSLNFLKLAIFSFIEKYPEYKKSILVFDDDSTDKTKEWLDREKIKHTTWNSFTYVRNMDIYKKFLKLNSASSINLSLRNSFMVSNLLSQISSKYVLLNDADIIFLKPNFLEEYSNIVQNNIKIIAPIEHTGYNWGLNKHIPEKNIPSYLGKYNILYNYNNDTMIRFHFCHALIDLDYFKSQNLLFDDITDSMFIKHCLNRTILETGSGISYEIFSRKIPYYNISEQIHNSPFFPILDSFFDKYNIYHFRLKSSIERLRTESSTKNFNIDAYAQKSRQDISLCPLLKNYIKNICNTYDINIEGQI